MGGRSHIEWFSERRCGKYYKNVKAIKNNATSFSSQPNHFFAFSMFGCAAHLQWNKIVPKNVQKSLFTVNNALRYTERKVIDTCKCNLTESLKHKKRRSSSFGPFSNCREKE